MSFLGRSTFSHLASGLCCRLHGPARPPFICRGRLWGRCLGQVRSLSLCCVRLQMGCAVTSGPQVDLSSAGQLSFLECGSRFSQRWAARSREDACSVRFHESRGCLRGGCKVTSSLLETLKRCVLVVQRGRLDVSPVQAATIGLQGICPLEVGPKAPKTSKESNGYFPVSILS